MNVKQFMETDENMSLIEPDPSYKDAFMEMIGEWEGSGEKMVPFVLRMDMTDFDSYLETLHRLKTEPMGARKTVNHSTFWMIYEQKKVLGVVIIRHDLNDLLLKIGGHIEFGIRPGARRKGYGTRMLALALDEARKSGLERVLMTCEEDDLAARKTILKCGGELENRTFFNGKLYERYWISL